jgi:hypothetical protein
MDPQKRIHKLNRAIELTTQVRDAIAADTPTEPDPPTRPPVDPPTRPPVDPPTRPPVDPPTNDECPDYEVRLICDGMSYSFDPSAAVRDEQTGAWIDPHHAYCPVQVILTVDYGQALMTLVNSFELTTTRTVSSFGVFNAEGEQVGAQGNFLMEPARGLTWAIGASDLSKVPDPGTAHPDCLPYIKEWMSRSTGFQHLPTIGTSVYWPFDGNKGGGAGVYADGMEAVFGSPEGIDLAASIGVCASNRHRMWRFSEEAWASGILEAPELWSDPNALGFYGFDKTGARELRGWEATGLDDVTQAGFNNLDSSHRGRLNLYHNLGANHGMGSSLLHMRTMADEVVLGWYPRSEKAANLSAQSKAEAYGWFGCREILGQYPARIGCHLLGRGFGHDLQTLCNAEHHFPGRYTEVLLLMEKMILHVWPDQGNYIFSLPKNDPIWGRELDAYSNKINIDKPPIPAGQYPNIQRTFEEVIVWAGICALSEVLGSAQMDNIAEAMRVELSGDYNEGSAQLRAIGHPEWNTPAKALGTLNVLGLPNDPWNNGKDFATLLTTQPGIEADNPVYSMDETLIDGLPL